MRAEGKGELMAGNVMEIRIADWPEMLAAIRKSFADMLREEADAEADPRLARKLRAIALAFEVDQKPEK